MTQRISRAVLCSLLASTALAQSYIISTAVGAGAPSNVQAKATSLGLGVPAFLTTDSAGNIYFADQNSVIEVSAATGLLTVVAGNGTTGYSGDAGPATSRAAQRSPGPRARLERQSVHRRYRQ
jgi:hypothetical protein